MLEPDAKVPTGGRRTAEVRRESIIAAARTLFAQHGFHSTGMAEIARVSQVLVGQIYRDFASKEEVIAAIVERDVTDLLDDLQIANALKAGHADELTNWLQSFVSRRVDDETLPLLADIISEARRNPRIAGIVASAHNRLRSRLADAVAIWAPGPENAEARENLADIVLSAAGAVQHRQLFGFPSSDLVTNRMIALVESEISSLASTAGGQSLTNRLLPSASI